MGALRTFDIFNKLQVLKTCYSENHEYKLFAKCLIIKLSLKESERVKIYRVTTVIFLRNVG
jgi:hypothetical protein